MGADSSFEQRYKSKFDSDMAEWRSIFLIDQRLMLSYSKLFLFYRTAEYFFIHCTLSYDFIFLMMMAHSNCTLHAPCKTVIGLDDPH